MTPSVFLIPHQQKLVQLCDPTTTEFCQSPSSDDSFSRWTRAAQISQAVIVLHFSSPVFQAHDQGAESSVDSRIVGMSEVVIPDAFLWSPPI
jgi:hypothetical protein